MRLFHSFPVANPVVGLQRIGMAVQGFGSPESFVSNRYGFGCIFSVVG
jgi:hypothetical protein